MQSVLTAKKDLLTSGELALRSFTDYKQATDRIVRVFGKNRRVDDLAGEDFAQLRADIAKGRGPTAIKTEITRIKMAFTFAFRDSLIDKPVNFGTGFDPPKAKTIRKALTANGPRMFEAAELRAIIAACPSATLKAMVLLAANSGMGNNDVGLIPESAVNLETGWVNFPRQKTGTERRFRMWPETTQAIKASLAKRPTPKPGHESFLFLTRKAEKWSKDNTRGVLAREFKKILEAVGITRDGAGFYDLRRTFQTIGEEAGEIATRYIMGHVDGSMSARYRQRISDERLQAVTDHVRSWLFPRSGGRLRRGCGMSDDLKWIELMPKPPYADLTFEQVFHGLGAELIRLSMLRCHGRDPSKELDSLLDWVRKLVLGQLHKGVSLLDAARIMCRDKDGRVDEILAADLKNRWQRVDRSFYLNLPEPVGISPEHAQVPLYEPSAILPLIEIFYSDEQIAEGHAFCREKRLKQELERVARYPRPYIVSI